MRDALMGLEARSLIFYEFTMCLEVYSEANWRLCHAVAANACFLLLKISEALPLRLSAIASRFSVGHADGFSEKRKGVCQ